MNETQFKQEYPDMKIKYYYNENATICLLIHGKQVFSRGVAICSPMDNFNKQVGRAKALGRAVQALVKKSNCAPFRYLQLKRECDIHSLNYESIVVEAPLYKYEMQYNDKASYMPELTDFEKTLTQK